MPASPIGQAGRHVASCKAPGHHHIEGTHPAACPTDYERASVQELGRAMGGGDIIAEPVAYGA